MYIYIYIYISIYLTNERGNKTRPTKETHDIDIDTQHKHTIHICITYMCTTNKKGNNYINLCKHK